MTPLPPTDRRRHVHARVGALVLDALLLAYAMWCVQFLGTAWGLTGPFLQRWPLLLLTAPLLALLWQARGTSLGQLGYRSRWVDPDGAPATVDQRSLVALGGGIQVLLVAAPALLLGGQGPGLLLSVVVAGVLLTLSLLDARGRGPAERLAGVETTVRPIPDQGIQVAWVRRFNAWVVLAVVGLTFSVAWHVTEIAPGLLWDGWKDTKSMISDLVRPDWSITGIVIEKIVETVFLALMASICALPVAFVLSFLGARNVMTGTPLGRVVYFISRFLMNFTRSVEPIIQVIIFVLWVGTGPFAGMLALFVHSVASLSKLYSEAIESIDGGPVEALRATGASSLHVIRYAMVPQVIPPFLSFTMYRWDINVRMATIVGFVGGGGIGQMLGELSQLGVWPKIAVIIVFITLVVWLMDIASSKARERLL